MICIHVREVIQGKRAVEKHEEIVFLRHLRTCSQCRVEITDEEKARAIHAVIMSNE